MIAGDVHAAFAKLDAARPDSGGVTCEHALLWRWQSLPTIFPNERDELANRYSALFDGS